MVFDSSLQSSALVARERDVKLTMTLRTYGTKQQSINTVRDMLRVMEVKGFPIINAEADTISVTARKP
jgi:hypothetical protein